MDVVKVYGYIVELPFANATDESPLNLYYFDVSRGSSCPRVFPVRNGAFRGASARNPGLFPTPISTPLTYESKNLLNATPDIARKSSYSLMMF